MLVVRQIVILSCWMLSLSSGTMPAHYDTREKWGKCASFLPENQGSCNACAASSIATSLGIRACIRDGRNIRFSPQRIWDCCIASCEEGVNIESFMLSMLYGDMSRNMLVKQKNLNINQSDGIHASNISQCIDTDHEERITSVSFHKQWWLDDNATNTTKNSNRDAMQREIIQNGPIISVLYLTANEKRVFSQWRSKMENDILVIPPLSLDIQITRNHLHAVTVIGWGTDANTRSFYWKILNSFGESWGNNGVGNIPHGFGLVEHEWYSIQSTPIPCIMDECVFSAPVKNQSIEVNDDEIFFSISQDVLFLDRNHKNDNDNSENDLNHKNGAEDAAILGFTVGSMSLISLMICSIRLHYRGRRLPI